MKGIVPASKVYKIMPQLHVSDCLGSYSAVAANISGAVYAVEPQYVSLVK